MTRRSRIWLAVDAVFIAVNAAGAVFAAAHLEALHAATHFALAVAGVYVARLLLPWGAARPDESPAAPPRELTDRLTNLAYSIDAIAVEIERIGEWQRVLARSAGDPAAHPAPAERAAEGSESDDRK